MTSVREDITQKLREAPKGVPLTYLEVSYLLKFAPNGGAKRLARASLRKARQDGVGCILPQGVVASLLRSAP